MKFQAILPNRDFIMNLSLLLAKAPGEARQNVCFLTVPARGNGRVA